MDLWGKGLDSDLLLEPDTGLIVSRETAARVVAVYACVRLRAEAIASLPVDVFRRSQTTRIPIDPPPLWIRQPNPEQTTWFDFAERVNTSLDLDGNAYALVTAVDRLGFPAEVWTLHPDQVQPLRDQNGRLFYLWNGQITFRPFDPLAAAGTVLHIRNVSWGQDRAPSPIGVARQAVGLALAAEKFGARYFGKGSHQKIGIELPPAEGTKTREFIQQMREQVQADTGGLRRAFDAPFVATGGSKITPISITNEDAQFLETRKFQVTEIARLYGIPPHMIGDVEKSTSWGTGIEQQGIGFVQYTLGGRLARLEASFNQLLPRGQFIKFNVNALLRGDSTARAAFYKSGIDTGWMLKSEARRFEDLPEVPGIDAQPEPPPQAPAS